MKKMLWLIVGLILAFTIVGPASAASLSVQKTWNVHGVAARVETVASTSAILPMGDGTHITLKPGASTWVHYPVPTPTSSTAYYIYVSQYLPVGVTINRVDVWDGHVREYVGGSPYAAGTGAWRTVGINTGTKTYSEGMDIVVAYKNTLGSSQEVIAGNAGAIFTYSL